MKKYIKLFIAAVCLTSIFAFACQTNNEGNKTANTAEKQTYKTVGVVKKIDIDARKITIDHEDIPNYMPAMQMEEDVSDVEMLEKVKVGDKVEFEIERTGAKIVVTKLNKIDEVAVLNGSEIYKTNCAECHGGIGEGAKKGIPLISGHALHHTEDEYIKQVMNGEGKKMPAFKDKLSAEQIAAVVKFVREDLQKDSVKNPKDAHHH
jgi:Cu/Ag efflux protein CusF